MKNARGKEIHVNEIGNKKTGWNDKSLTMGALMKINIFSVFNKMN